MNSKEVAFFLKFIELDTRGCFSNTGDVINNAMYQHPAILVLMVRARSLLRKEIQKAENVLKCLKDRVVKPLNGNFC